MTPALLPQAALAAGVLGALGLGLLARPPRALVRFTAWLAPAAALLLLPSILPASAAPLIDVDFKSLGWQFVIYAAALPLALQLAGDDVEAALFLGAVLGMGLLAAAANLPMIFLSLEFMSLPAYLLVARGGGARRLEAAIKYFFAGSLAGALFMLGLALWYSETRSLGASAAPVGTLAQAGLALMGTAALFKLGIVPLHWWLPDVYEAAPPPLAGFLSTAMKAAAALFLLRVVALAPNPAFAEALPGLGAASALLGALLALRQRSLQRLLAYSSISHAGLMVLGVGVWERLGRDSAAAAALLFYLAAYALMSNGAFLALQASGARARGELRGLSRRDPLLAAAFAALLFSLGGIPPTGGFLAKLLILWQALRGAALWPAVIAGAAALVSLGYYLALVRELYLEEPNAPAPKPGDGRARLLALACALGAVALAAAPLVLRGAGVWG